MLEKLSAVPDVFAMLLHLLQPADLVQLRRCAKMLELNQRRLLLRLILASLLQDLAQIPQVDMRENSTR